MRYKRREAPDAHQTDALSAPRLFSLVSFVNSVNFIVKEMRYAEESI